METSVTRPFRLRPPDVDDALLRRELLRSLLDRFEARVTVVHASAGFGKTTAVAQAISQNRLAPRGVDVWLGCEPGDADEGYLLSGIAKALDVPGEPTMTAVVDAVAARSPAHVCLVLDDLHEIPAGSSGALAVDRLVADLPANGHLLVTSRHTPPLTLTRLVAQNRVRRINESDLVLSTDEIDLLAHDAGKDAADLAGLGGWPALVALKLRSATVGSFLNEEILTGLGADQRSILEVVVAIGGGDRDLLSHLTGLDVDNALGGLPMVHRSDGWYEAHDLWSTVFASADLSGVGTTHFRRAVDHLLDNGRAVRAVEIARRSGEVDLIQRALHAALIVERTEDTARLRLWLDDLPDELGSHPLRHHLLGLVRQASDPTTDDCRESFEQAAAGFATLGELEAQVSAVAELGFWYHIQRDARGLMEVGQRMLDLADRGAVSASPYLDIINGFVALSQGDPDAMLSAVRRARSQPMTGRFSGIADWIEVQAKEFQGFSDVELADRYLESAGAIRGTEVIAVSSRWRAGRVEELLADPGSWAPRTGSDRAQFLGNAWLSAIHAGTGNLDKARQHLALAERTAGERSAAQVIITLRLPRVLITHESGDIDGALVELLDLLDEVPLEPRTRLSYNGSAGMIARYAPHALSAVADHPLPPRDVELGGALREMDETADLTAIALVPWPESHGMLLSSLFLRTATEFIAAAWAAGRPEAQEAVEWGLDVIGVPARERFRDWTEHDVAEVAVAAKEILAHVPVPPSEARSVAVLGPERLLVGEYDTDHDDWRRERVRALLGFLLLNPDTTRDAAMVALWPEASDEAGRRNLRSTLNLLLGVLEPARRGGDAAFYIRTDGQRLRLRGGDRLNVDVWDFDRVLNEAAQLEVDGAPSLALASYLQALDIYRGGLLPSVTNAEWLDLERQRLHLRYVNAAIRGAELLLAHGRVDEAVKFATAAVAAEPWSEPAHRVLVAAHLDRGDRAAAHRAMQKCHELLDEVGGPTDELTHMLERRLSPSQTFDGGQG